jgi:glutamate synthase (NADPH/NADH) small chain
MQTIPGTEFTEDVDLLILAMGFVAPIKEGMLEELEVELDNRGNVKTDENSMTSVSGVFAAGDMRRGQSLVVWAINEGRAAAQGIEKYFETVEMSPPTTTTSHTARSSSRVVASLTRV